MHGETGSPCNVNRGEYIPRTMEEKVKLDPTLRKAGIFVPAFALRTEHDLGIGDTAALRQMVDCCKEWGISVLQILPINETSNDNSPYMAISAMAIDYTTLDLRPEVTPGLQKEDIDEVVSPELLAQIRQGPVNYRLVKPLKLKLLEKAYARFCKSKSKASITARNRFETFTQREHAWLEPYTLFRALGEQQDTFYWEGWPEAYKSRASAEAAIRALPPGEAKAFELRRKLFSFIQWLAFEQWAHLKNYADSQGVEIMGDIPFGINRQSADVWANPEWFNLKWSGGAPPEPYFKPDKFTEKWGQNWGIPIYDWAEMQKGRFEWWRRRVNYVSRIFHLFRIDHVLGFYRIYSFPWQPQDNHLYVDKTPDEVLASVGKLPQFLPGDDNKPEEAKINLAQGEKLLKMVIDAAEDSCVIAEDLGVVPNYMRPSLTSLGIPGFKIPMFEKDEQTREYRPPEQYPALSVATLATHDHEPISALWERLWQTYQKGEDARNNGSLTPENEKESREASWELYRTERFAHLDDRTLIRPYEPAVREGIVHRLFTSNSYLAILMITDLLGIDLRFNVPGPVAESNWSERLPYTVTDLHNLPSLNPIRDFLKKEINLTHRKPFTSQH